MNKTTISEPLEIDVVTDIGKLIGVVVIDPIGDNVSIRLKRTFEVSLGDDELVLTLRGDLDKGPSRRTDFSSWKPAYVNLEDFCRYDPHGRVLRKDLYEAFCAHTKFKLGKKLFFRNIRSFPGIKETKIDGADYFTGIALLDQA
jgi:hypothetical protein